MKEIEDLKSQIALLQDWSANSCLGRSSFKVIDSISLVFPAISERLNNLYLRLWL